MSDRSRLFVASADLPPEGLRALEARGRKLLLCRVGGDVYAIENRCPHAMTPLDGGRLEGVSLECPLHGGRLDVRDGCPLAMPIRRPARTFPVREVEGGIEIQLAPAAAGGTSAPASGAHGGFHA